MKTVLFLAGLVAVAVGLATPQQPQWELKSVDTDFLLRQKKVLSLLYHIDQVDPQAEYYKTGYSWDLQANINNFNNQSVVTHFLDLYKDGFIPRYSVFSIFDEEAREGAIALFNLFIHAKDFETFYQVAASARVHLNPALFVYTYYVAIYRRADTQGIVLPAPYEIYPHLFLNSDVIAKLERIQMQDGFIVPEIASQFGLTLENNNYYVYANYSDYLIYGSDEAKLAYFTEDVGLNAYYYYFQTVMPFWMSGDYLSILKERRGEIYYYFYQQLMARYYLERLANGLGEIPRLTLQGSTPLISEYRPNMFWRAPFVQRSSQFEFNWAENSEELQFLDFYEKMFLSFLEEGHFKMYNQEIDLHNSKAVNFLGNFWQGNADLYEKFGSRRYQRSYENIFRRMLTSAPDALNSYSELPASLDFPQTSLRDPAFYQLYSRIINYMIQYKEYLEPHTTSLNFAGVKISNVKVDQLVTYFDYYDFEVSNSVAFSAEQLKGQSPRYMVRQPRLNHKAFSVNIDIKSNVAADAVIKIFLGPKYDSNGYPIKLEDNWMNFVELDWSVQKLSVGQNKIERKSQDFFFYREDSTPITQIWHLLEQGKVPLDMSENYADAPSRLMLPRGSKGGYPFQIYVVAYPYQALAPEYEAFKQIILDNKPFGYPLDRPVHMEYFNLPNMVFEDVLIYHEGELEPYMYNVPTHLHQNQVLKH